MAATHLTIGTERINSLEEFKDLLRNHHRYSVNRKVFAEKLRRGVIINWLLQEGEEDWAKTLSASDLKNLTDTDAIALLIGLVGESIHNASLEWKDYLDVKDCIVSFKGDSSKTGTEEGGESFSYELLTCSINYNVKETANDKLIVYIVLNNTEWLNIGEIDLHKKGSFRLSLEKAVQFKVIYSLDVRVGNSPIQFIPEVSVVFGVDNLLGKRISEVKPFGQGYALVKLSGLWYYADKEGCFYGQGYDDAHHFSSDGYAAVKRNGRWGFINRDFTCVTGFIYDKVGDFSEGLAYFEEKVIWKEKVERGFLNTKFDVVLNLTENYSGVGLYFDNCFKSERFKIWSALHAEWINKEGRIVKRIDADRFNLPNISEISTGDIINNSVSISVRYNPATYESMEKHYNYLFFYEKLMEVEGCISEEGLAYNRKIIGQRKETDYYDGGSQRLIPSPSYSLYGYINHWGEWCTGCVYLDARSFSEHFAAVENKDEKWAFINNSFLPICDFIYDDAGHFSEGFASVKLNDKWGYINTEGRNVIRCEYDAVHHFAEGIAPVCKNNKWGAINQKGLIVIPCMFDELSQFAEGYCFARYAGQLCFLDKTGHPIMFQISDEITANENTDTTTSPNQCHDGQSEKWEPDYDTKFRDELDYANNGWWTPGAPDML